MNDICYVDSSALVKRYVDEIGSKWMKEYCDNANRSISIADIGRAEVIAAFKGKLRDRIVSEDAYHNTIADFNEDVQGGYQIISVTSARVDEAIELIHGNKLRGYDAVHLACALHLQRILQNRNLSPLTFVAADKDLLAAAQSAGLVTENPNDYS